MTATATVPSLQSERTMPRDARYLQLVELAPDGILIHRAGRIVFANAAAVRLTGALRRSEVVGQPIGRFLDPPYLKGVERQLTDDIGAADVAPPVRDRLRRFRGGTLEVEIRAVGFIDQGVPAAHLVIRDISGRLAIELASLQVADRLHQARRLESVSKLAGGVAHEIRNMMQVILGLGAFLKGHSGMPGECLDDVKEIMTAAERATTVTGQLLAYSRRAIHRPMVIDLAVVLRAAAPMMQVLLGEGRHLAVDADEGVRAWMDASQLEEVLMHLILNARDAMANGGTVTVAASIREVPGNVHAAGGVDVTPGQYATITVSDPGSGIEPRLLWEIFEPFFTTKALGKGIGMGLAAVQGILSQNNGYVSVRSNPGEGAAFTVYLPALRDGASGQVPREPAVVDQTPTR